MLKSYGYLFHYKLILFFFFLFSRQIFFLLNIQPCYLFLSQAAFLFKEAGERHVSEPQEPPGTKVNEIAIYLHAIVKCCIFNHGLLVIITFISFITLPFFPFFSDKLCRVFFPPSPINFQINLADSVFQNIEINVVLTSAIFKE